MSAFTDHTVDLPSGPVSYRKDGSGRPILHLHSSGGPRQSPVIEALAARHAIFQPTTPGFNGTPAHPSVKTMVDLAELTAAFTRQMIGEPCDVIAESFGGWVALWLAIHHPDLVAQLVLQAPAGLRDEGSGGLPADPAERLRALYAHPERAPPETRSPEVLSQTQRVRDAYVGPLSFDSALHAALPGIKARTLIVFGTKDQVVPVATAHRLKAGIAHSHLSFIYDAGHVLEYDQPQRVARLIGAFLERGEAFVVRSPDAA